MDLNYLLYRHQISLDRSQNAGSIEARTAHAGLAQHYADRIDRLRQLMFPLSNEPRPFVDEMPFGLARA